MSDKELDEVMGCVRYVSEQPNAPQELLLMIVSLATKLHKLSKLHEDMRGGATLH